MSVLTAESVSALSSKDVASKDVAPKKNAFARAWDAFVAARMRQAEREIALHRHLIPAQFEQAGERLVGNEKDLPFAA